LIRSGHRFLVLEHRLKWYRLPISWAVAVMVGTATLLRKGAAVPRIWVIEAVSDCLSRIHFRYACTASIAARRNDLVKHRSAAVAFHERALDRFDLAAHAADPIQQLELFALALRQVDTSQFIG
jgi:hypothetical protein